MSEELSNEYSLGLRNGASAPHEIAISAYFLESVETKTRSMLGHFRAAEIDQSSNEWFRISSRFLSFTPLEPDRAGMIAYIFLSIK
jgi:hypothetical protein